jgi:hypothetical protein
MTEKKSGMTEKKSGMTKKAGMTKKVWDDKERTGSWNLQTSQGRINIKPTRASGL